MSFWLRWKTFQLYIQCCSATCWLNLVFEIWKDFSGHKILVFFPFCLNSPRSIFCCSWFQHECKFFKDLFWKIKQNKALCIIGFTFKNIFPVYGESDRSVPLCQILSDTFFINWKKKKPQYSRCFTSIFIYINIRIAGGLDSQNNTKTKHGDEDVEAKQEDVTSSQGPFHQPPAWVHPLWDLGRRGTPPRACLNQTS